MENLNTDLKNLREKGELPPEHPINSKKGLKYISTLVLLLADKNYRKTNTLIKALRSYHSERIIIYLFDLLGKVENNLMNSMINSLTADINIVEKKLKLSDEGNIPAVDYYIQKIYENLKNIESLKPIEDFYPPSDAKKCLIQKCDIDTIAKEIEQEEPGEDSILNDHKRWFKNQLDKTEKEQFKEHKKKKLEDFDIEGFDNKAQRNYTRWKAYPAQHLYCINKTDSNCNRCLFYGDGDSISEGTKNYLGWRCASTKDSKHNDIIPKAEYKNRQNQKIEPNYKQQINPERPDQKFNNNLLFQLKMIDFIEMQRIKIRDFVEQEKQRVLNDQSCVENNEYKLLYLYFGYQNIVDKLNRKDHDLFNQMINNKIFNILDYFRLVKEGYINNKIKAVYDKFEKITKPTPKEIETIINFFIKIKDDMEKIKYYKTPMQLILIEPDDIFKEDADLRNEFNALQSDLIEYLKSKKYEDYIDKIEDFKIMNYNKINDEKYVGEYVAEESDDNYKKLNLADILKEMKNNETIIYDENKNVVGTYDHYDEGFFVLMEDSGRISSDDSDKYFIKI